MSVAVPPGLYTIQVTAQATNKLAAPASPGGNVTVNTISTQVWQVTGDGTITAFSGLTGLQARTNNIPAQAGSNVVANSGSDARWIISEGKLNSNTYWTAYIMTNDGTNLYWSIDGSNNVLVGPKSGRAQFTLTPAN
ncbi:hypothetical protein FB446DRAFT_790298 [Lentinula raphanica]|uniref:Uncharacterized protein n=1 Tax=Lentinula raphanica TaxID=153919 RepID=A0AA38PAD8_9AGAR|nr:hypothetical protein C8R42DRAFT_707659 [Lentinula raphanica]KAJ3770638.1 hypothetical protein FB446DRAFT_790298 [Lentinula raphanica]KAJ3839269.1 hypothetical protein F5878DRAFT_641324 [Lentinula raphanica]